MLVGWLDIPCLKSAFLLENLATMSQSSKIQVPCLCLNLRSDLRQTIETTKQTMVYLDTKHRP